MHINDLYLEIATGCAEVADVATGGTFNLIDKCPFVISTGTGTKILPDVPKAGVFGLIKATGTVTITSVLGVTTTTLTSGGYAWVVSTSSTTWVEVGGVYGASEVTFADGGGYTLATNLEDEVTLLARNALLVNTAISTAGAGTLTAAALAGGIITRSGPTAAYTDTTATATQIVAALDNGLSSVAPLEGYTSLVLIKNTVAFPQTLAAGAGVTLSPQSVIPSNSSGLFLMTVVVSGSGAEEVTILGLGNMPQANVKNSQFTTIATDTTITAAQYTLTGARIVYYATTAAGAGGIALTTRTATEMFADIPNAHIGFSWTLRIISDGGGTVTLTAGTGVTITGTATSATNTWKDYCCTFTSATALTMQNVGIGTIDAT